ncbi:MAG TPA: MBL fold metallo-hydrolase [Actinomycetota bacterium]|nr:MBL fold metallo-hydrolase [Actinomycetota bacterium]
MSLTVTILGCSGMYATATRAASGYLLELNDKRIWLDAGSGTWRNLLSLHDYVNIDGVILSHRHPDHTSDVFQAFHARHYGGRDPLPPIPLWGPEDTLHRIAAFSYDFDNSFDLREVKPDEKHDIGGASFEFFGMAHICPTVGVRITDSGKVFAYSADSGPAADFDTLARDADVFVCEATYQDADELWEGHMSGTQAGQAAASAGAQRLLLTHLTPGYDDEVTLAQARNAAGGVDVELAHDMMRIELSA